LYDTAAVAGTAVANVALAAKRVESFSRVFIVFLLIGGTGERDPPDAFIFTRLKLNKAQRRRQN
jgi:hypothetical protein